VLCPARACVARRRHVSSRTDDTEHVPVFRIGDRTPHDAPAFLASAPGRAQVARTVEPATRRPVPAAGGAEHRPSGAIGSVDRVA